ncbi:MAG: preprotein translocase subunit SecE [bacterium]
MMKLIQKPVRFMTEVNQEMSKVSWPSYDELKDSTIIVIILSLILAAFIFLSDSILSNILKVIF